jgi:hypothetical protein
MKYATPILIFCLIQNIANAGVKNDPAIIDESANPANYPVKEVYKGKIPALYKIKKDAEGLWRDKFGKMVDEPNVNFAGKYFISVHSCGTGCRYYQMHDLVNAKEIAVLDMFSGGDPPPMTKDGWRYVAVLNYKKESNLLVAQYLLEKQVLKPDGKYETEEDCRERSYIFENEELKPISKTRYYCTDWNRLNKVPHPAFNP